MPIKGVTDKELSFPEVGKIRKGDPKTSGGRVVGKDLDYFRFDPQEGQEAILETVVKVLGEQPRIVPVMFPFNEIERVWDAWLEGYKGGRMVAQSDGEIYHYLVDGLTGEVLVANRMAVADVPVYHFDGDKLTKVDAIPAGRRVPYIKGQPATFYESKNKKAPVICKPRGRLKVMLPFLERAVYWTALTNSWHDCEEISRNIGAIRSLNDGELRGIPCKLQRVKRSIQTPEGRYAKWLLNVEADPEWIKGRLLALKDAALSGNGLALPAPQSEPLQIEAEIVVDDFEGFEDDDPGEPMAAGDYSDIKNSNDYYFYAYKTRGLEGEKQAVVNIFNECGRDAQKAAAKLDEAFPL